MRKPGPLIFACILAAIVAGGAIAQTSLDEPLDEHSAKRLDRLEKAFKELRSIVFQGRESGQPVVVQPADTASQVAEVSQKLEDLDRTLTRLNGENEIIRHDLDEARHETLDLHAANDALTARVAALEGEVKSLTAPPPPPAPPPEAPQPPQAAVSPGAAFAHARALMQSGDTAGAESALRAFVDTYGDTPRGPEARYLLGRTLIARQAWADAATAEIGAIRGWPQTAWAPSALIELSRALVGMQKNEDACQTLGELAKRYPRTSVTVRAQTAEVRTQAQCA